MKLALDVIRGLAKVVIAICDLVENIYDAWPGDGPPESTPDEAENDDTDC